MKSINVLILEHDPNDLELLQYELKKGDLQYNFLVVENRIDFESAIQNFKPEIILSDYSHPSFDGLSAFRISSELCPGIPFIIVSGAIGDEKAVELIKIGITDYVLKEKIYQINLKIVRALNEVNERNEKRIFNQKLQESEQKYRALFQYCPIPMWVYDPETFRFLNVNEAAVRHYGYTLEEFLNLTIKAIRPEEDIERLTETVEETKKTGNYYQDVFRHKKKNGELIYVNIQSNVIDFDGKAARLVLAIDITDRMKHIKAIEEQNNKLHEIAWMQSHVVRAPLARMMGLINYVHTNSKSNHDSNEMLSYILTSAEELDEIIREIVKKSEKVSITNEL